MISEEEIELRNKIADEILELQKSNGVYLTSVFALLWIKKCADRARGIA